MQCKLCGKDVPALPGHRPREYCSDAHKQAYYRRQRGTIPAAKVDQDQAHVSDLARDLQEARARIEALERDLQAAHERIVQLSNKLDLERRFLGTEQYGLKTWLKKQRQRGLPDIGKRLLGEDWLEPRAMRLRYELDLRQAGYTGEDIEEFRDLWRLMLLDQA